MFKQLARVLTLVTVGALLNLPTLGAEVTVIRGFGSAQAISPNQFAGTGYMRVGGTWVHESSIVTLLALGPGPGGSLVGSSSHTIDLGGTGTVTTLDELRLVPMGSTGLHHVKIDCLIVAGTGAYAQASGRIVFHGTANLATGRIYWIAHGHLR